MTLAEFLPGPAPCNLEAERAVLGAILLEPVMIPRAIELLTPEEFYKEGHRKIYAAMVRLFERSEPADVLTVAEELKRAGELDEVGGQATLATLMEEATVATQFASYAQIVREKAGLRRMIVEAHGLIKHCQNGAAPGLIDRCVEAIAESADRVRDGACAGSAGEGGLTVRGSDIMTRASSAVPWAVHGVFAVGTQGMILGASHTGKSWALFDLGVALAHEAESTWFGQRVLRHGVVVLESWEQGQVEDLRRLQKLIRGRGLSSCSEDLILVSDPPAALSDEAYWRRRLRELHEWGAIAYLFDSLSEGVAGELNDNAAYSAWWRRRIKPLLEAGMLVVFSHLRGHRKPGVPASDRDSASRGATQIRALSSAVLELREAGEGRVLVKHNKHRQGTAMSFGALTFEGGMEEPAVTLVLTPDKPAQPKRRPEDLDAVANLAGEGRPFGKLRDAVKDTLGVSASTAVRVIREAVDLGLVVKDGSLYQSHGVTQCQGSLDTRANRS